MPPAAQLATRSPATGLPVRRPLLMPPGRFEIAPGTALTPDELMAIVRFTRSLAAPQAPSDLVRVIPGEVVPSGVAGRETVLRDLKQLEFIYSQRLETGVGRMRVAVHELTASGYDKADPLGSLARIARIVASWVTGMQHWAMTETAGFLRALVAHAQDLIIRAVKAFTVPRGIAGTSAAGIALPDLTHLGVTAFETLRKGIGDAAALERTTSWFDAIATNEPHRAANMMSLGGPEYDTRLTGRYVRMTEIGACDFCVEIAGRGYVWATAGFPAHRNCHCTAVPELRHAEWNRRMARYRARRTEQAPQITAGWTAWRPGGNTA
jgi:hypothetical protein